MSGLYLKHIVKKFGSTIVLDDVSLDIADNELLVLLGPSGCGKSTLLRLIAGLEELTSGEIFLHDKRIDHIPPKDRGVAMVFQNYSLYPHMSVRKNIAFPLKVARLSKSEIETKVVETARLLGLHDKLDVKPGELSGGQRQRVALGRAIVREPSIFLLDEPLSNLDADLRGRMRQEIVAIQKKVGRTMIHVTHDQAEALTMADRIALMNEGKIEQLGSPEELYQSPRSAYVARFLGFPKINLFPATITNDLLQPFSLPVENKNLTNINDVTVGVRPEHIELVPGGKYNGVVTGCEYLGEQYIITVRCDQVELVVANNRKPLNLHETVAFSIDSNRLLFFDPATGQCLR